MSDNNRTINATDLSLLPASGLTSDYQINPFTQDGNMERVNFFEAVAKANESNGCEFLQSVKFSIPAADVLQSNSTPKQFGLTVPSRYAIQVISAAGSMAYNSTPYATNGNAVIRCVGANSGQVVFDDNGFLFGTVSRTVPASYVMSDGTTDTFLIAGADLEFYVETGNPTAGDSDITVYVLYRVIPL